MTVMTYTTLKQTLITNASRPNDTVLLAQIPQFILFGQLDLTRKLNILGTEKITQGNLIPGISTVIKPALWLRTISFMISNPAEANLITQLERRTYEFTNLYTASMTVQGTPIFYAEKDINTLVVAPVPSLLQNNDTFKYEMIYHELYSPLTESVQTNILTQRYPDLLNYACSVQMYLAMQSFSLQQMYESKLQQGIEAAMALDQSGIFDRGQKIQSN